jgi:hypothetical protein
MPGGNAFVNRGVVGQPFVSRGVAGNPLVGRGVPGAAPFVGHRVSSDHLFAWIGHRRVRHIFGFIPGIGYAYYWYYDDCYVLTDYGWINICGYDYRPVEPDWMPRENGASRNHRTLQCS